MSGHTPTVEQSNVVDAFGFGADLVVQARAGSGKTSTLKMLAASTPERGVYLAYNKAIAADAARDFPARVVCKTAHALAFGAVGKQYAGRLTGPRVPARETARLLRITQPMQYAPDRAPLHPYQLARLGMETVRRYCYSADAEIGREHVPYVTGLSQPAERAMLRDVLVPIARRAWDDLQLVDGQLKFDHDVYLKMWCLSRPQLGADYVMLDEAQDANPAVAALVTGQHAQRVLVGDACQPAGTLVTVVNRYRRGNRHTGVLPTETHQVPIEEIRPGAVVVSLDLPKSFLRRTGSTVTGVTARPYRGELVTVQTEDGLRSRYTPDHHCLARFGEDFVDQHVVYVMRRGGDYRIGMTSARMVSQSKRLGVVVRASTEQADAVWILSAHANRVEAAVAEQVAAWTYGVPTLTFRVSNRSTMTQDDLDTVWSKVGGNRSGAQAALVAHGRSIDHPLWQQGDRNLQTRRPTIMRACNLMPGMDVLPLSQAMLADGKRTSARRWVPISASREWYDGAVYSMTVENDHTYVGDGILTHNCQSIYGWRGATDAMSTFDGQQMFLSQSFRFGPQIACEANKWLTLLRAEPLVTGLPSIPSTVGPAAAPDAILCRSNAGAVARAIGAMDGGRSAALVGGAADFKKMAEAALTLKQGMGCSHPELFAFRTWGEVREYVKLDSGGSDLRVFVDLIDKYGASKVMGICERLVDEDRADVVISTAHKAKGREWKSVAIASDFREPKDDPAGYPGEVTREDAMLAYVAVTRARLQLDREGLAWVDRHVRWLTEHLPAVEQHAAEREQEYQPQVITSTQGRAVDAVADDVPEPLPAPAGYDLPVVDTSGADYQLGDRVLYAGAIYTVLTVEPASVVPGWMYRVEDRVGFRSWVHSRNLTAAPEPDLEPVVECVGYVVGDADHDPSGRLLSPDCYRCRHPYRDCTCPVMPDRRPLEVAHA